ncbi:glycogen debranching protein GlgX [Falsirhodobacter sp. alg1]|uniref:glycogen debranching protein GlgX n=1 Tax=Falsirhodobacter sp. alg1 TaxID=1472418 RepID=UPI0007881589|nr:glycogen debranching protein GlgX [Falsirhodobacter sp. alg1]
MNLGATITADGTQFAVFSAHAEHMDLCLFNPDRILPMTREGDIWSVTAPDVGAGDTYAFRAHGLYAPDRGYWFNSDRLLLDPYARELTGPLRWQPAFQPDAPHHPEVDMPRCVVRAPHAPPRGRPNVPWNQTIIYEAHVRGLTMKNPKVPRAYRGTFEGIGSTPVIRHLKRLGVTTLQLLPVQAFIDDRFIVERGLSNYWGYQTLGYFAPDPRYGTPEQFRAMVRQLHKAGIELILDIVLNHTGEGDEHGPSLAFRGLDAPSYYRMSDGRLCNEACTGNTLDFDNPMVVRMAMDALRFWAGEMGVDGFRFDLATVLGRRPDGFSARAPLFDAIRQDPLLRDLKMIAEPWDMGPDGYQLGSFPPPFAEWNDKFRDDIRHFWRGDGSYGALAARLSGSAEVFDRDNRPATRSINYLTCHDGFTLTDVVSYAHRHNEANGEEGRDGHPENISDNMGMEGPDKGLKEVRALRRRNLLATLMLAQGTPMVMAGDEMGNTQYGNNNTYSQDNELGWVDWSADPMRAFLSKLAILRSDCPLLGYPRYRHGTVGANGRPDIAWLDADARPLKPDDWADLSLLTMELNDSRESLLAVFNQGAAHPLTLPYGRNWQLVLDTTQPDADQPNWGIEAPAHSVLVFRHID